MRKLLSTILLLSVSLIIWGCPVTKERAKQYAESYFGSLTHNSSVTVKSIETVGQGAVSYYIINFYPQGWMILSGDDAMKTRKQLCELRLEMGERLGLRDKNKFALLWVTEFPMFEWSDEENRLMAMHHPFTHPMDEDIPMLDTDPAAVRADAYDMVCNGVELGGGSIRIHDPKLQAKMFEILGFTPEKAEAQFGFLINAFKYGAPPHAGLAFGLDRFVSIMAGLDSIRDCIAFPKNNSGRDVMLDAPGELDPKQLEELQLKVDLQSDAVDVSQE